MRTRYRLLGIKFTYGEPLKDGGTYSCKKMNIHTTEIPLHDMQYATISTATMYARKSLVEKTQLLCERSFHSFGAIACMATHTYKNAAMAGPSGHERI
jgi:hypothetical protein